MERRTEVFKCKQQEKNSKIQQNSSGLSNNLNDYCNKHEAHEVPMNFFLLGAFTVVEAVTVGVVVSLYEVASVIKALVLTTAIVVSLTLYTLQSKRDFSKLEQGDAFCHSVGFEWRIKVLKCRLMMGLIVIIGVGFMNLFFVSKGMELLISGAAAAVFSLFIVYDTHMMMEKLSAEEYILATINLYLDIINLFLELLRIFGDRRN
ncbi:Protein lifeguard 4 [Armadillidium vulgare]|nr:Protein lifeguard 4 [Armadillidium vulgare]